VRPAAPGPAARVARNAAFKVAIQATRLLSLAFLVHAARVLGPERFGQFTFAYALATLLGAALDLGMHAVVVREVARRPAETAGHWAAAATLKLLLLGPAALLLGLVPALTARPAEAAAAVWLLGLAIALQSFIELAVSVFTGFERVEVELGLRVVEKLVLVAVGLGGLALGGGLLAVSGAFAAAAAASVVLATGLVHHRFARLRRPWAPAAARRLAWTLGPIAAAFLLAFAAGRLVPLVVALVEGDAAAGYLGAATRVLEVALVVPTALAAAAFPALARAPGATAAFARAVRHTVEVLLLLGLPVALAFAAGAETLTGVVFGPAYAPAAGLLRVLAVGVVLAFVNVALVPVFLALDRPGPLVRLAAVACGGTVVVAPALVRALGAPGGALALVLVDAVLAGGAAWTLWPVLGCPLGRGAIRSLAGAAAALLVALAVPAGPWRLAVALAVYALAVAVLRPWPPLAWRALLQDLRRRA
jgi:O-antigen/teichoic acid export membrane protein